MKELILAVIWLAGVIISLLGEKRLRQYKNFENPRTFLIIGILLCVFTSWLMVIGAIMNCTFEFPKIKKTRKS